MLRSQNRGKNDGSDDKEEKLKKLYHQILSYCREYLPDENAAGECTQEVFAAYFETAARTEIHSPRAWLYRTADNYLHRYNRNRLRELRMTSPLPETGDETGRSGQDRLGYEPDFDRLLEESSNMDPDREAEKIFAGLSEEERKLYDLHYRQRLPLKEIAASDGLSPAASQTGWRPISLAESEYRPEEIRVARSRPAFRGSLRMVCKSGKPLWSRSSGCCARANLVTRKIRAAPKSEMTPTTLPYSLCISAALCWMPFSSSVQCASSLLAFCNTPSAFSISSLMTAVLNRLSPRITFRTSDW